MPECITMNGVSWAWNESQLKRPPATSLFTLYDLLCDLKTGTTRCRRAAPTIDMIASCKASSFDAFLTTCKRRKQNKIHSRQIMQSQVSLSFLHVIICEGHCIRDNLRNDIFVTFILSGTFFFSLSHEPDMFCLNVHICC